MIAKVVYVQGVGVKRITREELDVYEREYLEYADGLWCKVYNYYPLARNMDRSPVNQIFKSMLSPFQYWLIERLQIESIESKEVRNENI